MSLHSGGLIQNATLLTGLIQKHHTTQGGRDKGPGPFMFRFWFSRWSKVTWERRHVGLLSSRQSGLSLLTHSTLSPFSKRFLHHLKNLTEIFFLKVENNKKNEKNIKSQVSASQPTLHSLLEAPPTLKQFGVKVNKKTLEIFEKK